MRRTVGFLFGAAAIVIALDLGQKQLAISDGSAPVYLHDRPLRYVVAGAALTLGWAGAIALTRSALMAVPGGVVLGGAAGNLISFALWPSLPGVPDPIVAGGLAFSVGDLAVATGLLLLVPASLLFARRNRRRLFDPLST
jgi:lipoprotein signal peptidase